MLLCKNLTFSRFHKLGRFGPNLCVYCSPKCINQSSSMSKRSMKQASLYCVLFQTLVYKVFLKCGKEHFIQMCCCRLKSQLQNKTLYHTLHNNLPNRNYRTFEECLTFPQLPAVAPTKQRPYYPTTSKKRCNVRFLR